EQLAHFFVARLREIFIVLADRLEIIRRHCTDDLVDFVLELAARLRRADGGGDHDPGNIALAQRCYRRAHRRPSGKPVVDEYHSLAAQLRRGPTITVAFLAPL